MRIIGGTLRGRKIEPPLSRTTRPMMDRVRQALFNILAHQDWGKGIGDVLNGTHVLDAFCGTGALAFEAISYGAAHATLFDKSRQALDVTDANAEALGIKKQCAVISAMRLAPARAKEALQAGFPRAALPQGTDPPGPLGAR